MMERIIYKNTLGEVMVIIPAPDCGLDIHQIAAKDVPFGRAYRIVDAADLPPREDRARWDVATSALTDGTGADYGAGSDNEVVGWADDAPVLQRPSPPVPDQGKAPTGPSILKLKPIRSVKP